MANSTEEVTEKQAEDALRQLSLNTGEEPEPAPEPPAVEEPTTEPVKEPQAAGTEETVTEETPAEGAVEPEGDDVESLKKRIETMTTEAEETEKRNTERMKAVQDRNVQSEEILTKRFLQKSTSHGKLLKIVKDGRSESGVSEADADRAIQEAEGTMNRASASYAQPEVSPTEPDEDQQLVFNSFLNEKGMTTEEAGEFGKWIKSDSEAAMSPNELAVYHQSLPAFLRLAHTRFKEAARDKQAKVDDAVGATRSVQRTQKEAARAASASPAAPRKQPASPKAEKEFKDFTTGDISKLLRQSVEHPD